eukprot:jgi/Mesen1/9388/ME000613S08757
MRYYDSLSFLACLCSQFSPWHGFSSRSSYWPSTPLPAGKLASAKPDHSQSMKWSWKWKHGNLVSGAFAWRGRPVREVEVLGVVVSLEEKDDVFVRFAVDDGTACVACILWLQQHLTAVCSSAHHLAAKLSVGEVVRVQGQVSHFRTANQVTVHSLQVVGDPNMEILHWLDCIDLCSKPPPDISVQGMKLQ